MPHVWTVVALSLLGLTAQSVPDDPRQVVVRAESPSEPAAASEIVDRLHDGEVLHIRVEHGVEAAAGSVRQCRGPSGDRCFNSFPVQFDADGIAWFQYQIADPGQCGAASSCVFIVGDEEGERVAVVATVFDAATPPRPTVIVTPTAPYRPGEGVRVEVTGLMPGAPAEMTMCGSDCGPTVSSVADATGVASATMTIGTDCRGCRISVLAGVHTITVPLEFEPARYEGGRLAAGLFVAAALLFVAWRIVAAVDWRPPSEADAPELDAAELEP